MPGEMIDYGAKALKPVENYISNYLQALGQPGQSPGRRGMACHEYLGYGQYSYLPGAHFANSLWTCIATIA